MELLFELFEKKMVRLKGENKVCLTTDDWDDFNFVTMFYLTVFDEVGNKIEIGNVKIGYQGQKGGTTSDAIPLEFTELDKTFFSLGQDPEYYQNIVNNFLLSFLISYFADLEILFTILTPIKLHFLKPFSKHRY
jgi:hypothetical protein